MDAAGSLAVDAYIQRHVYYNLRVPSGVDGSNSFQGSPCPLRSRSRYKSISAPSSPLGQQASQRKVSGGRITKKYRPSWRSSLHSRHSLTSSVDQSTDGSEIDEGFLAEQVGPSTLTVWMRSLWHYPPFSSQKQKLGTRLTSHQLELIIKWIQPNLGNVYNRSSANWKKEKNSIYVKYNAYLGTSHSR